MHVTVQEGDLGQPFAAGPRGPASAAAHAAFERAFGQAAVELGNGGTIPFVAGFAAAFPCAEVLVTSAGADPDCRAHGADESLHLGDFERACLAETLLLDELAQV